MEVHGSVLSAHTQGETQGDTQGETPWPSAAAPFVDSSIWVSPWVRVRVFGTPGQRCVVLPMGFSLGLNTEHCSHVSLSQ